jgi:DNA-binding NarL/FixJ family response regulator
MRVLYVDDHTPFRAVVQRRFLIGHEVVGAADLAEARRHLADGHFEVILLDYQLSDGLGEDLIREIVERKLPTKVVAVSANAENNARLIAAGAIGAVSKNEFSKLAEKLETILGEKA